MSGKRVTSDIIERNGKVYAPIADIAKAFGHTVVRDNEGYTLVPLAGVKPADTAKPVKGLTGSVGETLGNGQVSVRVMQVVRGDHYVSAITGKTFTASPDTDLVVVICQMQNVLKKTRSFDLGYFKKGGTVLTDTSGKSFTPKDWDRREPLPQLQAGTGTDFAVIFEVPKITVLSEFVYAVRPNDFDRSMRQDNFRVLLTKSESRESTIAQ